MKQLVFFVSFICLFVWSSSSQEQVLNYEFVSVKEGISKVGIYTIIQDDLGFIWLGTNGAGLYRYDGISYGTKNNNWSQPMTF